MRDESDRPKGGGRERLTRLVTAAALVIGVLLVAAYVWLSRTTRQGPPRSSPKKPPKPRGMTLAEAEACFRKPVREFMSYEGAIFSVALSPDGSRALSGSIRGAVILWDTAAGKEIRRFQDDTGGFSAVFSVALSPDGSRALAGGREGIVRLWDADTGAELRQFAGHERAVLCIALSADGRRLLSGGFDGTVRLWDVEGGNEIRSFAGHTDPVVSVAFSPDGRRVLAGSWRGNIRLWEAGTGQEVGNLLLHTETECIVFSPEGTRVLVGVDTAISLWDLETGRKVRTLAGHQKWVRSVAFSPDGKRVLSGSVDGTLRLWDLGSGRLIRSFEMPARDDLSQRLVLSVAFSPDGKRALSGGYWRDAAGDLTRTELLLWRLPDEEGLRLLGTQKEP